MGIAGLTRARLAREDDSKGAGGLVAGFVDRGASGQTLEGGLDGCEIIEGVETVGAAAEFAWGLRAAEHEKTEDSGLVAAEIEDSPDPVLVLGDASIADGGDEGKVLERVEGLADLVFGEIEHRVAAGTLVARIQQRVEREGIVLGGGDLLFDKGAQDAELVGGELHGYKGATGGRWRVRWQTAPAVAMIMRDRYEDGQAVISQ
jgi:hypothetical protein